MPDLPKLNEILDLFEKLQSEQPKSIQGVKAAGRRARKILVQIRYLCPEVRRELRDRVVYPGSSDLDESKIAAGPVKKQEAVQVEETPPLTAEQIGRYIDLSDLDL